MGYKKFLVYGSGLILAVTGPISLFTASDFMAGIKKSWFSATAATASPAQPTSAAMLTAAEPFHSANASHPGALPAAIPSASSPSPDSALPTPGLAEVFSFDVTIDWVMHRWPRVSTGFAQVQLQGYRVSLVTGTSPTDLAGSLTYYFNPQQQVQQIAFRGVTGDASALVALLATRYHFTRRLTNDPGMMLYEAVDSSNQLAGMAKIRSARVITANQPYSRFEVDLTIDRPQ
jgi:hypothetical protein